MPDNDQPFDITDDNTLRAEVRSETLYDDDDISQADLQAQIRSAKRVLALKADVEQFYNDRGIAVALFGTTCAKTKGAIENSPVRTENIGPLDVTFRTSDGSSLQLAQYEEMVQEGLSAADTTDTGVENVRWTHTHYGDENRIRDRSDPLDTPYR